MKSAVSAVVRGRRQVASRAVLFADPSRVLTSALVNGGPGVIVVLDGRVVSVMGFTVTGGKIVAIDSLGDPDRLRHLELDVLLEGDA